MKIISIIFDNYLAVRINGCAQKNKISISELIRDLLYEKMQQGHVVLHDRKKIRLNIELNPFQRQEMGYIIFAAKLLEKFVLATVKQGEIMQNLAFEETENLLKQMNFNSKQRLCISLENTLFIWLQSEASRLQLKVIPLIRKLIESYFIQNDLATDFHELSYVQKIAIKHQITTCKLLEKLVEQTVADATIIIGEVRTKTDNVLLKLSSAQQ